MSAFRDGLSKTLCLAEVKAFTSYERNAGLPQDVPIPVEPAELPAGGEQKFGPPIEKASGHTEWVDGRVHQTGFTATFAPNTNVSPSRVGGRDIDWTNQRAGTSNTVKTFAAVTSRSHHPGVVLTVRMDGSAQAIPSSVDLATW
jgi:hypothetical protein